MVMIAMVSAKAAPGVTTSVALLASQWPGPVIVADADPTGGDIALGWLGTASAAGEIRLDQGVLSFVEQARMRGAAIPPPVQPHLQRVPDTWHVDALVGVTRQASGGHPVQVADWRLLAQALRRVDTLPRTEVDVLVDCGRYGPDTPWPMLDLADLVLIATRPQRRYLFSTLSLASTLKSRIEPRRLGLAVCGAGGSRTAEASHVLGLPVRLALPYDLAAARVYSDGTARRRSRSRLDRVAAKAAARLRAGVEADADVVLAETTAEQTIEWPAY